MRLMPRIFKIFPLLGIISCSDFPEISYESRLDTSSNSNIQYGEEIDDIRQDADGYSGNSLGGKYKTVIIGDQTWMAENLNYKIPQNLITENGGYKCINCNKYGVLYNWEAAMKVCPANWRLPDDNDWRELLTFVGGQHVAGMQLKSKTGWLTSGNGEDRYGFAALPGGVCFGSDCALDGSWGGWWSATSEENRVFSWIMVNVETPLGEEGIFLKDSVRRFGGESTDDDFFSVRCIKD